VVKTSGKEDAALPILSPFAIGLFAILGIVLSISGMAYGGYRAGVQQRTVVVATAVADEIQLQYSLAVQDIEIGQLGVAVQRLEYIIQMDPEFPGAARMLAKARESANGVSLRAPQPTDVTLPVEERLSADELFNLLTEAYHQGDWSEAVLRADVLKATDAEYRSTSVDSMLFVSLSKRGIERIDAGVLELGLTDLEHAEQIIDLDDVALQRRRWASLYLAGKTFWELNWKLAIDNFSTLNQIAPNFLDTRSLLRNGYVAYGEVLLQAQDACLSEEQFAAAVELEADAQTEQQLADAKEACGQTRSGSATPSP